MGSLTCIQLLHATDTAFLKLILVNILHMEPLQTSSVTVGNLKYPKPTINLMLPYITCVHYVLPYVTQYGIKVSGICSHSAIISEYIISKCNHFSFPLQ